MVDMTLGRQKAIPAEERKNLITSATFVIEQLATGKSCIFSELAGITSEVEQAEYMEAGIQGPTFGRFLGKAKPPTVTLKRSMSSGSDTTWIWAWHAAARTGSPAAYLDTTLKLYSAGNYDPMKEQQEPVKTYMLTNAVPTKVEIAGMKAGGTEVVLQTVTLQCDAIEEPP